MGKRLKDLTKDNTKCMISVNGEPLIHRLLNQLEKKKLNRIVIVVGYKGKKLVNYVKELGIKTKIEFIENKDYDKTNNIYSLALAKEELCKDDTLLFESDIIFEDSVLDLLIDDPYPSLALVDKYQSWMDGTCVKIDAENKIQAFISKNDFRFEDAENYYKTVNIYKFSKEFSANDYIPFLEAYVKTMGTNEYYEQVLKILSLLDVKELRAKQLSGQNWYEIDDIQDLDIASSIFANNPEEKLDLIMKRYGGYWRYPGMLDYCYLVNPYYPPKRMVDELKYNFETLLTQYPSGLGVNSLLAGKMFDINQDNIIIGNGASELIKSLIENTDGRIGFIQPTFQEYPNRSNSEGAVFFTPSNQNYAYSVKDLTEYFENKSISTLVIVNPENPTGNYIDKKNMLKLVEWCGTKHITLILDESFVDFSEENGTLLTQTVLDKYPHLILIKSISKSYGIPGLRLGILASGNKELIANMKKDVSIWNINSFAEYYLQIQSKYENDYANALSKFKEERARFYKELSSIRNLRIIPSQSNYFMIEITGGYTSRNLTATLLADYNILVKDLSKKISGRNFVRVAIRNEQDNNRLIDALRTIMD